LNLGELGNAEHGVTLAVNGEANSGGTDLVEELEPLRQPEGVLALCGSYTFTDRETA
jgi:hypothetical protein